MTLITFYRCLPGRPEVERLPFPVGGFSLFEKRLTADPAGLGGRAVERLFRETGSDWVLWSHAPGAWELPREGLERLLGVAEEAGASWLYAECRDRVGEEHRRRHLADYQPGSLRDDFDFGPFSLIEVGAARRALECTGGLEDSRWGGLYDLRLRLAEESLPLRLPECLAVTARPAAGEAEHFRYLDPSQEEYQKEMERLCTAWLRRTGGWLPPRRRREEDRAGTLGWELAASVVIPVRDREETIGDALASALAQQCSRPFNVVVVDNHSTDGTGEVIDRVAAGDDRVVKVVPRRRDLGIGGCWNEAAAAPACGRYLVQLDSDDLFSGSDSLERILRKLVEGGYGMVVGAYRVVDFDLNGIPPGLVDHREWTADNGHNNLLRVNGVGAPRAYSTYLVRRFPFPDVSYGEDYAMALRISREYEIGRIYDPLYLCRRWRGNSDAGLSSRARALNDTYKDRLRTLELAARRRHGGE